MESMVSAEHYESLEKERDQLLARVGELEGSFRMLVGIYEDDFDDAKDLRPPWIRDVLNRTPAQSLLALEARVLRELADGGQCCCSCSMGIRGLARHKEQEANNG